ncbi:MAG TPA: TlpA disulfide reductase family protein [Fimbriimonadaceae bacterium]|nr:TlpA disulfide reductase family protein [Fimbriimonadaceae bacterium]
MIRSSAMGALACLVLVALLAGCSGDEGAAHDFKVVPLDDQAKTVSLADFKGKTVLLDFWATWCGPCNAAMPEVQMLWDKYRDKGLEVVAITHEDRQTVLAFHKAKGYTYPVYLESDAKADEAYGVDGIPKFVLIRNGRIIWQSDGYDRMGDLQPVADALN